MSVEKLIKEYKEACKGVYLAKQREVALQTELKTVEGELCTYQATISRVMARLLDVAEKEALEEMANE